MFARTLSRAIRRFTEFRYIWKSGSSPGLKWLPALSHTPSGTSEQHAVASCWRNCPATDPRRERVRRYDVCVKRTTIMLPDDVDARLRLEARRRGTSIADVAREAIERQLPPESEPGALAFLAIGEGGPANVSKRADEYVAKAIRKQRKR